MERIKQFLRKYREFISYAFWGVATTVVNYAVYFVFTDILHTQYLISNGVAWLISVLFAFVVNKIFVFRSQERSGKGVLAEAIKFASSRIASAVLETLALLLFVQWLKFDDTAVKIIAGIGVVLANYVFGKFFVFTSDK